jgi:hypothetical protein
MAVGTKEGKTPLPGTLNPHIRPCQGVQSNTSIGRLTPARRLVSTGPLYTTWFLHTRCAGASRSFRLQTFSGLQGQALLPAPGISPGDLVRFPGSPCHPGSRRSPLPQGALPFGGRFPLLSSQLTLVPASHPAVKSVIAYPDPSTSVASHGSQKEVSSSHNLQLSPLPRLHPQGLLRVSISAISWMSPGLRARSQTIPINDDAAAVPVTRQAIRSCSPCWQPAS